MFTEYRGIKVRQMGRGDREGGHRGGKGHKGRGVRGSDAEKVDPAVPEDDPYRDLRIDDEEQPDPASEEYIWPTPEEEDDI